MLTMSETKDVTIYNKNVTDQRITLRGRTIGPWTVVNTGRHTKWGVYDTQTGMRIFHACPTLTEAKRILAQLERNGLELVPASRWDGVLWGDHTSYEGESIRAIAAVVRPYEAKWTGRA